jgi:hypothetical protein
MATEYTSQPYWGSKQDLAAMIAHFIGGGLRLDQLTHDNDWCSTYGHNITCWTCGGTGRVNYGKRVCPTCDGTGQVWLCRIDLSCGLRDWKTIDNFFVVQYYSYVYKYYIKCPYCLQYLLTGGYGDPQGYAGRLDAATALLEHIETVHPDHPLTEPA